jgi:Uma2 family endonuclease
MKTALADETIGTLLARLGVPGKRVHLQPPPGTATAADCLRVNRTGRPCELVERTLVEKPVGTRESVFANLVAFMLTAYTLPNRLGIVCVTDAIFRMQRGNLRLPDVSFTLQHRLPDPLPQIGGWCPDLCIEILSPSNTRKEMSLKRRDFFDSGARIVWEVNPARRTARIYTAAEELIEVSPREFLTAEPVLPGYRLALKQLYADFDELLAK